MIHDPSLNLKLGQLRLIAAIAEHRQLQVAASVLALSQPAASRMLAEVERVVGVPLFTRTPKGMEPTEVGRVLARRAHAMSVGMQDLAREVAELRQGRGGSVRVGSVTGPAVGYLVPAIRQLKGAAPDVQVMVDVAPSTNLVRGLMAGEYDFIIGRLPPEAHRPDFTLQPAGFETVGFLARRDHPLADLRDLPLSSLAQYEWIIQDRGTPIRQVVDEAMAAIGTRAAANVITTSSLLLMMALLSESNAVAPMAQEVVALISAPDMSRGFTALHMAEKLVVPPYYIIEMRGRLPSAVAQRLKMLVLSELAAV